VLSIPNSFQNEEETGDARGVALNSLLEETDEGDLRPPRMMRTYPDEK